MAEVIWLEPAERDVTDIAEYIALEDPIAAGQLVDRIPKRVHHLVDHPRSGSVIPELPESRFRQLIVGPCRVFHRFDGERVYIYHIRRSEQLFRPSVLEHD